MNKLLLFALTISTALLHAQVNSSLPPKSFSFTHELGLPAITTLSTFQISEAERLDLADQKNGELPKFSRSIFTDLNLNNSGKWTSLQNGDRIWRLKIVSENAQALLLYYNRFFLPEGATLHTYTEDKSIVRGAFTSLNNPKNGYFSTGITPGESCIVEYYEPQQVAGKGDISIHEVGHAYRWADRFFQQRGGSALGFGQSSSCEVNVNCDEGNDWQDQKRAVSCIIVQSQFGQGVCSGALLNNVREDCTPLLLSAQHCSESVSANQYSQWIFYFNYESPDCSTPNTIGTLDDDFIVGCSKIADSNDNGGDDGSDFLLLQLNNQPPAEYNVYYAGWNVNNTAPANGVCIHHPEGDIKKISSYQQSAVSSTWGGSTPGTHWRVKWVISTNGHGVTEPGSSGSPLFNNAKQVVGKLTGGDSFCNTPNSPDFFGKLSYDWISNGTANNQRLKPWLDPDNTGVGAINGRNADCFSSVGNNTLKDNSFSMYPNPANDLLQLSFSDSKAREIVVIDISGRVVVEQTTFTSQTSLNTSALAAGVYFVRAENQVQKLIIE